MPQPHRFWSTDRNLTVLLVSLVLVIFVVHPLQQMGIGGRMGIGLFFSFLLISGVAAVAKSARTTVVIGALVLASLTVRWLRLWRGGGALAMSDALFSSLFCTILAVGVLVQVMHEGPITTYRIQGAVAFYLLMGLAWAFAYEFVALHWANAFIVPAAATNELKEDPTAHFVYFSFITLTTVGYGDIIATHPIARSLVTLEALVGQLFPAVLLARLVTMEVTHRQSTRQR